MKYQKQRNEDRYVTNKTRKKQQYAAVASEVSFSGHSKILIYVVIIPFIVIGHMGS
jgi:hypothetical protein